MPAAEPMIWKPVRYKTLKVCVITALIAGPILYFGGWPADVPIATFSGGEWKDGHFSQSKPFTTANDWSVRVETRGDVSISVTNTTTNITRGIGIRKTSASGNGVGEIGVSDGGTWKVAAVGKGTWRAWVYQHPGRP